MTHEDQIRAIQETADEVGGSVRDNYSGKGMYGSTCYGIVCASAQECIEAAAAKDLRGSITDRMGRDYIVYWPSVKGK